MTIIVHRRYDWSPIEQATFDRGNRLINHEAAAAWFETKYGREDYIYTVVS